MKSSRSIERHAFYSAGFSLAELLVTIVIVSLLAAMLIPALGRVRQTAGKAKCLGHLRQIGVGVQHYIAEQNGKLPPEPGYRLNAFLIDTMRSMGPEPTGSAGMSGVMAVAQGPKVDWWICPADPTRGSWIKHGAPHGVPGDNENRTGINASSYVFNVALAFRRITEITRPAQSIITVEFPWGTRGTRGVWPGGAIWTDALPEEWHQGDINCLFVDGHVESIKTSSLKPGKENYKLWYADYPASGVFPKISY